MSRWTLLAVLVLLLAALLLLQQPGTERAGGESADLESADVAGMDPDLYMEDTTVTQFNEDGSLRYRLAAARISHFEREDLTRLDAPALEIRRPQEPPWSLVAKSGTIRARDDASGRRGEVVFLEDDVRLTQARARGFVTVSTDAIEIHPERRFATTDRAVMIDTNAGRTRAIGLTADLDAGLLKLSSDRKERVHTIVLPGQFRRTHDHPNS